MSQDLPGDKPAFDCAACDFMAQGWGGPGCCEHCDMYRIPHTCEDQP